MFNNIADKPNISKSILLFINFAYLLKYTARLTVFNLIIAIIISGIIIIVWRQKQNISNYIGRLNHYVILVIFVFVVLIIFHFVPKETLNIDRWSVITSFWDNFFANKYVYYAKSFDGNNPGPMPFYFIIALPFYFINELGFYSLLGVLLFMVLLKLNKTQTFYNFYFLLLITSAFILHEIVGRSNIFTNGMLIVLAMFYFEKYYQKSTKSHLVFGIIFGFLLSTRNVYVIPIIILFVFFLKSKRISFKNIIQVAAIAVVSFIATFLPFVWNHYDDFLLSNPFIIQSDFLLPLQYSLCFVIIAFPVALFCKQNNDVYFFSGCLLFATILFYHFYITAQVGFQQSLYNSKADITYFVLCIPFFIQHILFEEKQKSP